MFALSSLLDSLVQPTQPRDDPFNVKDPLEDGQGASTSGGAGDALEGCSCRCARRFQLNTTV